MVVVAVGGVVTVTLKRSRILAQGFLPWVPQRQLHNNAEGVGECRRNSYKLLQS
ncbi:hypothetical protein BH18ACI4_BH18ACI4_28890 [soil metagenome]